MNAIRNALVAFLGSRLAIGMAGVLFIAFAAHSLTAPDRLPPFGRVGLSELGILPTPPGLADVPLPAFIPDDIKADLVASANQAAEKAAPKAAGFVRAYLDAHPDKVRFVNYGATGVFFLLLALTIRLQAATIRRRRKDVYAFVDGGFGT